MKPLLSILLTLCLIGWGGSAYAESSVYINLERIAKIESNHNPMAFNPASRARGMYQITPICLLDWNQAGIEYYTLKDMHDPQKSARVAEWYLNIRIPALLRHYKLPDTIDNRLWAYNAGIKALKQKIMPSETKDYINKYHKLAEAE